MQPATQVKHPNRSTARTLLAAAIGLLPVLPVIAHELGIESIPWVASVLAITAAVTRTMAHPAVERWMQSTLPLLAAQPKDSDHETPDPQHRPGTHRSR